MAEPQNQGAATRYGIPQMGFGTYGRRGDEGIAAIGTALEVGYRHLDTAQDYDTEAECGEALRRSGLPRQEVFITTKVRTGNLATGRLVPSVRASLETIGVDRLDLVLIHWPSPNGEVPLPVYIEQLAEAQALGLTRLIGVSNFTIDLLQQARAVLGDVPIANNQVELNPYLQNRKLADYCRDNAISVTCYLPIARGRLAGDPVLTPIAERHEATVEQVALAWELQQGLIAIPTSGQADRIRYNFAATRLRLSQAEMQAITGVDRGERVIDPSWGPAWD